MDRQKCCGSAFTAAPQVSYVSTGMIFAGITVTPFNKRSVVIRKFFIFDITFSFPGKERSVPRIACRQHTVKHINTGYDTVQQILRSPDAHKVTRFIIRQQRSCQLNKMPLNIIRFTDTNTAYCLSDSIKC